MMITIPRDAIAGLIEDIKYRRQHDAYPYHLEDLIDAAATQLDSLLKERDALRNEINDWANEVARYKSYAEKFDQENAALQARVKELEEERACLKEGTSTAYSAMKKAIKLCQIDLKTDDWQSEDKSRRDLRLAIFRELDMPLAIVGNTERGGGPEKFCSSRLIEAESRALRAEQERDEAVSTTRYKVFDNLLGAYIGAEDGPIRIAIGNLAYTIFPEYRNELRKVAEERRLAGPEKDSTP